MWCFTDDVDAYAARAWDLLARRPAERTMALTVIETVRGGHRWADDSMLFGFYEDGDAVTGAVLMTPPYDLLLAEVPPGAVAPLVAALRERRVEVPGVNGDVPTVERFAGAWCDATSARADVALEMCLYRLGRLDPPA